ncbi:MAG: 1-acyl-sn-glycerol-3-phosphate acyltransferase [Chloroflexi bacterium]|nr:1-acyl-sn-glycerol-3-phosphate acyltransferase [Chloroflexota bacterium]
MEAIPTGRGNPEPREAKPYGWALSSWARLYRRLARPWVVARHVRRFCQPFSVDGREHLDEVTGPVLIVANHCSHFDTVIVLSVLPPPLYDRVAVVAAADRFYTSTLKSAWLSLRYNAFPIERRGGSNALAYSEQLLRDDWSLLIFPEGTRSKTGELLPFHPGPAILALRQGVPVVPMHIAGAWNILRPGTPRARPAPVHLRIGPPLLLEPDASVRDATASIREAVRTLVPSRETAPVLA